MANQDVKVSALQSASTLSTNDLSLETVVDELSETGYTSKKITEGAKASQYLESFTFSNLTTEAKTIVGAINEAATTGGNNVFYIHWTTPSTITETGADIAAAYADGSDLVILLIDSQTGQVYTLPLVKVDDNAGALNLSFGATVYKKTQFVALLQLLKPSYTIQGMDYEKVITAAINDTTSTSTTETWSANKINSELADKAEIADTVVSTASAWSSSQIVSLLPTESASGAVASFETPLTLPLVSHNVTIEPVQAGTGDPSPSNPRAISGHSSVTVSHSGADTSEAEEVEISLGQTVYGGELDVTNGVLRVTFCEPKIYSTGWYEQGTAQDGGTVFAHGATDKKPSATGLCDKLKTNNSGSWTRVGKGEVMFNHSQAIVFVNIDGATTTQDVNTFMSNAQLIYELETPVEITLTPEQINTLKGVNNIWADTGDTAVEFKQDIQTYIDSRLSSGTRSLSLAKAPVETKEETKQEEQEGENDVER